MWWGALTYISVHAIYRKQQSVSIYVHQYNKTLFSSKSFQQLMVNLITIYFLAHLGWFVYITSILNNRWHHDQPFTFKKNPKWCRSSCIHFHSNGSAPDFSIAQIIISLFYCDSWKYVAKVFYQKPLSYLLRTVA